LKTKQIKIKKNYVKKKTYNPPAAISSPPSASFSQTSTASAPPTASRSPSSPPPSSTPSASPATPPTIRELNELLYRLASAENSCIFFLLVYSSILDRCIHIFSYYVMLMGGSLRNVEKKKMNLEVDVKSFD